MQNAIVGDQPNLEEREPDGAAFGDHRGITQHGEPGAGADGKTFDGSDDRLFGLGDQADNLVIGLHARLCALGIQPFHAGNVPAGAKIPALAGQHQRMDRLIAQYAGQLGDQGVADFVVQRIALVWPVDRNAGDPVGAAFDINNCH